MTSLAVNRATIAHLPASRRRRRPLGANRARPSRRVGGRFDGLDNLTQRASPDTGTASATFDAAGDVLTRTDARGVKASYTYDALGRVKTIHYPTAALNVTYTWDTTPSVCSKPTQGYSVGHLTAIADGSGSTQFCFDRFGNVVKKVAVVNGKTFTTSYVWNLAHRLTQETTPTGTVIAYARDAAGRVARVTYTPSGGTAKTLVSAVTYAPFGPVTGITYGNGRTLTRSYDADYVVSGVSDSASGGLNLTFGRDVLGNLTSIASGSTGNVLTYDPLNRLKNVTDLTHHPQWAFTYDATGNRLSAQAGTATPVPYTYPTTSHHLYAVGTTLRGYDAAGDTTSIGTVQGFHYNDTGRMDQVQDGSGHATLQYATNALGQRVEKYLTGNASLTQYAIRDEAGNLIGEYDGNSNRIREVVWMDGMPVGVLTGIAGSLSYLEPDQLGTPRIAIDGTTNKQTWNWNPLNDPFGQSQPTGSLNLDLRLPGQTNDPESGLSYNYFRDYEAATGRYAESDPIGLNGGISTFSYVGGNPENFTDFLGLDREIFFWSPMLHDWGSWLGHVSSQVGDNQNYSFGPDGWDKTYPTVAQYVRRQTQDNKRNGLGLVVSLTAAQDKKFDQCMTKNKKENSPYSKIFNNCTTSAQMCLINAGVPLAPSVTPGSFQQSLFDTGLVNGMNRYRPVP